MEFSPTADFDGESREILIRNSVVATAHRPLTQSKGTVVLVPGWSGTRAGPADMLVFLASSLARAGWTAIRVEMPARGDSCGDFSDVDLDDMIERAVWVFDNYRAKNTVIIGLC